jgi:hypothetical protein
MSDNPQISNEIKQAEQRGYRRGYAAGREKRKQENAAIRFQSEQQAFLDKAFLAALPACVNIQGWVRGGKPIENLEQRTALAWDFAAAALRARRNK